MIVVGVCDLIYIHTFVGKSTLNSLMKIRAQRLPTSTEQLQSTEEIDSKFGYVDGNSR